MCHTLFSELDAAILIIVKIIIKSVNCSMSGKKEWKRKALELAGKSNNIAL